MQGASETLNETMIIFIVTDDQFDTLTRCTSVSYSKLNE